MILIEVIFWLSLVLIIWTYFGYYLFLKLISIFYIKEINRHSFIPPISIVITAHNEEIRIRDKIENTLNLNYPGNKLEIIIVSDGSTDDTVNIVKSYQNRGVKLLIIPQQMGKHFGQGKGVEKAQNEIIILSDSTTFLKQDAVMKMVRNFADPTVGCISSSDKIEGAGSQGSGESIYIRYEMQLRELESKVNSLIGASGSFYSIRKILCNEWHPYMSADFYLPLICKMKGFRTIHEPEALAYYNILRKEKEEFTRKVRTIVHGIDVLFHFKQVLNPFKYGLFSIQVISHKLIRWLVPYLMITIIITNIILVNDGGLYLAIFIAQLLFYCIAIIATFSKRLKNKVIFKIPLFFIMANVSILVAWYDLLRGQRYTTWKPTKR
ncbi:MAG: glycosyltransferase family 2 protein [Candidatus Thorarchaeota archaeon]